MKAIDEMVLANKLERQAKARNHNNQTKSFNRTLVEGNNETFTWGQINKALMQYGMLPSRIANVLSFLNEENE